MPRPATVVTSVVVVIGALAAIAVTVVSVLGSTRGPEGVLDMVGDIGRVSDPTHDPTLFEHDGTIYVLSTGVLRDHRNPGGIFARRSDEGLAGPWQSMGPIAVPEWTSEYRPAHLWAPHVVRDGDTYHLYYAASSFGRNRSAIGLMTTRTPGELGSWEDQGPVVTSGPGDLFNAIDPHVLRAEGSWWIAFGSHWDGIFLQRLDDDLRTPVGERHHLATRPGVQHNPIEAPTIVEHDGWFYLFTSWDRCCAGVNSTYRVAVGRSGSVTGPYVDRDGQPLLEGGGTIVLDREGDQIGPGGQDVREIDGRHYLVHHYYDGSDNGTIRFQIRSVEWADGWPNVARADQDQT